MSLGVWGGLNSWLAPSGGTERGLNKWGGLNSWATDGSLIVIGKGNNINIMVKSTNINIRTKSRVIK